MKKDSSQPDSPTFPTLIVLIVLGIALLLSAAILRNQVASSDRSIASKQSLAVFYVTASNREEGERVAGALVSSRLAACCNIIDGVRSIYEWEGKVTADKQVMLVIKSRQSLIDKIVSKVKEHHSYDVPQVIAMPIIGGSDQYTQWVLSNTAQE